MISEKQITPIGHLIKPHGINGEIVVAMDFDINLTELSCIILNIEGIYVPFFINSCRPKGNASRLIAIDDIDNELKASQLCNKQVFALSSECEIINDETEDGFYATDLVGFCLFDGNCKIGEIIDFDDSTENALFIVNGPNGNIYIPIADEMIEDIILESKTIIMNLPNGILDL